MVLDKMDKIIIVVVEIKKNYFIYGKCMNYFKKYKVYDENNIVKVGDIVRIMEICLLLVIKCFCLLEVVEEVVII